MLFLRFSNFVSLGVSVSDDILIEIGKQFGTMLGVSEGIAFNYTNGRLRNFVIISISMSVSVRVEV